MRPPTVGEIAPHPVYGRGVPERGWVPAPRYALRRDRVLALAAPLPRGRLLEVGCGAGALLADFADLGFACEALESSPAARELALHANRDRPEIHVHATPPAEWAERFDLLLSFEVLEHIEDDAAALALWRGWLRPGGRLLLSVPARRSRWSPSDVWAGHYRRYERTELAGLLERSGFTVEHMECYGFPLSNLTEWVRAHLHGRRLRRVTAGGTAPDLAALTAQSGTERSVEARLYPLQASRLGVAVFRAGCRLQERFADRELGTGYLVLASRR